MGHTMNIFRFSTFCAFLFFGFCIGPAAQAQLAINKLWVDFENPKDRRSDLLVLNESDDRYYINVESFEILGAGTEDEERVTYADPAKLGLLVTPNRIILDPGQARSLRVVRVDEDLAKDRTYRIRVEPKVGKITAEGMTEDKGMVVKLLVAYEVLVTSRPKGAKYDIDSVRNGNVLTITNTGTSNILVFDIDACGSDAPENAPCGSLGNKRIYPGQSWDVTLPSADSEVTAKVRRTLSADPIEVTL